MNGDTIITLLIFAGLAFSGGMVGYSLGNALGYKAGFLACSEIWDATEVIDDDGDDDDSDEVLSSSLITRNRRSA